MSVDIVIPTLLTQPLELEQCLRSLTRLKNAPKFVVWVVANTPQEQLDQWLKQLDAKIRDSLTLKTLALGTNQGFTGAVNAGILAGFAELVVLLNDDTEVDADWLSELVITQRRTRADMIASTIYLSNQTTLDSQGFTFRWRGQAIPLPHAEDTHDDWSHHPDLVKAPAQSPNEPFGPDAAAALYTRHLLTRLNNFRPEFFAYLEDVDVALRARVAGFRCVLAEDAVVYHHKHSTSKKRSGFKSRQDFLNWWHIVLKSYPSKAWMEFAPQILWERAKNLSGMIKAWR